jgi:hypothetical protein
MSVPYGKDSNTGHLITIRLLKSIFPLNFPKTQTTITVKFPSLQWKTSKNLETNKIHWKQSHSFDLPELSPMTITISYKSGFFSESEFSSCLIKTEIFTTRKGVICSEVINEGLKVQVFWIFVVEEEKKGENLDFLKLVNEVEAEREEVKFIKNKTLQKLRSVKAKRKMCKEEMNSLIQNFEPIVDLYTEKEELVVTPKPRVYNSRTYDPNLHLYMNEEELR